MTATFENDHYKVVIGSEIAFYVAKAEDQSVTITPAKAAKFVLAQPPEQHLVKTTGE